MSVNLRINAEKCGWHDFNRKQFRKKTRKFDRKIIINKINGRQKLYTDRDKKLRLKPWKFRKFGNSSADLPKVNKCTIGAARATNQVAIKRTKIRRSFQYRFEIIKLQVSSSNHENGRFRKIFQLRAIRTLKFNMF